MTREEILAMPAGRELDELVAIKVMGKKNNKTIWGHKPFMPSSDISAAWEVFVKADFDAERSSVNHLSFGQWICKIDDVSSPQCATAPEAICKASLLSVLEGQAHDL